MPILIRSRYKTIFTIVIVIALFGVNATFVLARTSTNYEDDPDNAGNSSETSNSSNFQLDSQVGDVAVGTSSGTTYEVDHGFFYPDGGFADITFRVAPEKRVAIPPPNWDISDVLFQVRVVGQQTPVLYEEMVGPTDVNGNYAIPIPTNLPEGMYDIAVKGISHITQVKSSVYLADGINNVDLSGSGTVFMLAGDVNLVFGDDLVNSLDIGTLLPDLNGSTYRLDLNQDSVVNSLDLGMIVSNLNLSGQ